MSTIRYRRNIDCITSDQLHDLREALAAMFELPPEDEHSFERIAGLHGQPWPSYCMHGYPGFLTWHRAYMEVFEKALRCFNSNVALPFWDWSSGPSTGVPAACSSATYVNRSGDTVPNPLYAGPIPASLGGGMTSRSGGIDTRSFDARADGAQTALANPSFSGFQSSMNGPHGGVHVDVGGQMGTVSYAGFDPIFYLHHCNVDRVWAQWQSSHTTALPVNEAALELEPFNMPYSADWKTGADFATTDQLGYRYSNFCFFMPPFKIWDIFKILIDPKWIKQPMKPPVRLVFKSDRMPARSLDVRVFVNEPRPSAETPTSGNPHFAGSVGMFGMSATSEEAMQMKVRSDERFDLEMDISKALAEQCADSQEVSVKLVAVGLDGREVQLPPGGRPRNGAGPRP